VAEIDEGIGDDGRPLALGVLEAFLGFRLRRLHNQLAQGFAQMLAPYELRPAAFTALALVAANPGVAQVEVGRAAMFDKALVAGLIEDLERRGWVERRRSPSDRRRQALYATAEGERVLAELDALARENERRLTRPASAKETQRMIALLDRIHEYGSGD
jgi:DNA-binding MarR family transcriptional regulator